MSARRVLAHLLLALISTSAVAAAERRDVLIVVNRQAPDAQKVADAYRALRDIPSSHVVALDAPATTEIARRDYLTQIEQPLMAWLRRHGAEDEITYIVLTSGVPLRVAEERATQTPVQSVDSALTLLYRRLAGMPAAPLTRNPLFTEAPVAGKWPAFDRAVHDIYLVTRLDGFTVGDALSLAARCGPVPEGTPRIILDSRVRGTSVEYQWFPLAADRLRTSPVAVDIDLDETAAVVRERDKVIGYFSWGSADPQRRDRKLDLTFLPGAVGASLSSSDSRTFREPPADWQPGSWQQRDHFFEGSPEWLAGDLVRAGITGWGGAVADPYLDGIVRPHVLFPAYLAGRSLGEAYFLATRYIGWRNVVLGDPLCRPFGADVPSPTFTRDERSGLTQPFLDRVLEQARRSGGRGTPESLRVQVAARARVERDDRQGALALLRDWSAAHPDDLPVLRMRALMLDPATERDEALAAYQAVLALSPDDVVAANNLAYALASDESRRQEALDLARRAYERTGGEPMIADTYGWVLHQAGDAAQALRVLRAAVARAPRLVEARLHLALVALSSGELPEARAQWQEVLKLAPDAGGRAEAAPLVSAFGLTTAK